MKARHTAIQDAAADWFGKRDGGFSVAQKAEFDRWIAADPRHSVAFERLDRVSCALDKLTAFRPAVSAEPENDLQLRRSHGKLVWLRIALAAAAALTIAWLGLWRPAHKATLFSQAAATEVGGLQKIVLPDGSVVELNTNSAINVRFTPAERRVLLVRGEAHFTVAKNPARPFVVEVRQVAVRAVGTAFNVRLRQESVEVLVTEGRVRVNDIQRDTSLIPSKEPQLASLAKPPELAAGQLAVIPLGPRASASVAPVAQVRISQILAWEQQKLDFDPTPLSALVDEFNRYNRHKLVVADPAIATLKVGGSFRVGDYDAFVRLLELSFGVAAERKENETVLRARK